MKQHDSEPTYTAHALWFTTICAQWWQWLTEPQKPSVSCFKGRIFFFMYSLKQPPLWNSCTLNVNKQQMKVADGISNTKSHMTYIEAFVLASPAKCTQAQVEKITRTQSLCCWAVNGSLSVCFRQIASMRESVNLPLTRTFLHLNVSVYPTSLSQHEVKVACALASALYSLCPNRSCSVNDMSWLSV